MSDIISASPFLNTHGHWDWTVCQFCNLSCNDSVSVGNVKLKISCCFCMQWCRFVLMAIICRVGLSLKQKAEGGEQPPLASRKCQAWTWALSHFLSSYHRTPEREISTSLSTPHHKEVLDSSEVSSSVSWTNQVSSAAPHQSCPVVFPPSLLPSFGHILVFSHGWPLGHQGTLLTLIELTHQPKLPDSFLQGCTQASCLPVCTWKDVKSAYLAWLSSHEPMLALTVGAHTIR